ncbi:hydroperoxide reductase [Mycoplasmoides pneumoniae]|uniref:Hydroperoxide reductase n=5 Tax=Mycoplasmoides pneumoniae TaxID=2104 RepID=HPRR_MYCPN|nr:hydroperoxide reductase [Mycoplasmoides pneumoniae]P75170.1 RecName: Full=Hydroperoxide reductase [Mycoplasmoides pneumoniae M129]AAB95865.1 osmotical inducible protein C like family protein [Mycoplasmoides pneumoniae M129]ADK86800.1 OsmC-like protein [Mycoplasmoides pneumoniae FH]AGC04497.1 hypothetical protein C985_0629 [Mycoplasmoides pneumoniae M129-B7]ALA30493.1 hypothetical protein C897_03535 [Mycoplasmoides pneumoniae PI 1428]ALA30786.1 hypothetical protein B434_01190 [Mycoplasmoide
MDKKYDITAVLNEDSSMTAISDQFQITLDARPKHTAKGFGPLAALLSGLAACELATANLMAPAKMITINKLLMNVTGSRSTNPTDGYFGLREINLHWEIHSPNSETEIKEFIDFVSKRCPAHNTLQGVSQLKINVNVTLVH